MPHHFYNSFDPACKSPFGAVEAGQTVAIKLNLAPGQCCTGGLMKIFEDGSSSPAAMVELAPGGQAGSPCLWGSFVPPFAGLFFYCFELQLEGQCRRLLRDQWGEGVLDSGEMWQLTVYQSGFATPEGFKGGVMYQIFPDRFCASGQPHPVPAGRQLHAKWDELPKYFPDADGEYRPNDFFGGDLQGIESRLDYLQSLGVTTLYLNPIFEAHSNHRYNTANFCAVDPMLGSSEDFARLCAAAKQRGISVMLDGVFSHTGSDSVYFNREGRYPDVGAWQSRQSPFFSWYSFEEYPDKYESWWGFKTLPEVNETDPAYLDYICGKEGVLHRWMKLGAAGWRLDVADELPDDFLDRLRSSVKAQNPEALVLGEVWEDASCKEAYGTRRHYLLGGQLDSVTNYPFRNAILDYVTDGNARRFLLRVLQLLDHYPKCVCDVLMNVLSTHDVERALTRLAGQPANGRDRAWQAEHMQLDPQQYARGSRLLRLAALLQYTLPGIPCLYYGDEAGLYGYGDPFNRGCYPWGNEDRDLVEFFKQLGQFRRRQAVLAKGSFVPLAHQPCLAFLRAEGQNALFVAVNPGEGEAAFALPHGFVPTGGAFVAGSWNEATHTLAGRSGLLLPGCLQQN